MIMANARACIFFAAMMLGSNADPVNEDMALDSSSSRHLVANKYAYAVPSDWYTHKVDICSRTGETMQLNLNTNEGYVFSPSFDCCAKPGEHRTCSMNVVAPAGYCLKVELLSRIKDTTPASYFTVYEVGTTTYQILCTGTGCPTTDAYCDASGVCKSTNKFQTIYGNPRSELYLSYSGSCNTDYSAAVSICAVGCNTWSPSVSASVTHSLSTASSPSRPPSATVSASTSRSALSITPSGTTSISSSVSRSVTDTISLTVSAHASPSAASPSPVISGSASASAYPSFSVRNTASNIRTASAQTSDSSSSSATRSETVTSSQSASPVTISAIPSKSTTVSSTDSIATKTVTFSPISTVSAITQSTSPTVSSSSSFKLSLTASASIYVTFTNTITQTSTTTSSVSTSSTTSTSPSISFSSSASVSPSIKVTASSTGSGTISRSDSTSVTTTASQTTSASITSSPKGTYTQMTYTAVTSDSYSASSRPTVTTSNSLSWTSSVTMSSSISPSITTSGSSTASRTYCDSASSSPTSTQTFLSRTPSISSTPSSSFGRLVFATLSPSPSATAVPWHDICEFNCSSYVLSSPLLSSSVEVTTNTAAHYAAGKKCEVMIYKVCDERYPITFLAIDFLRFQTAQGFDYVTVYDESCDCNRTLLSYSGTLADSKKTWVAPSHEITAIRISFTSSSNSTLDYGVHLRAYLINPRTSLSPSLSASASSVPTRTALTAATALPTTTKTLTATGSSTATSTASGSAKSSATASATASSTSTSTGTQSLTSTMTLTATPSMTPSPSRTQTGYIAPSVNLVGSLLLSNPTSGTVLTVQSFSALALSKLASSIAAALGVGANEVIISDLQQALIRRELAVAIGVKVFYSVTAAAAARSPVFNALSLDASSSSQALSLGLDKAIDAAITKGTLLAGLNDATVLSELGYTASELARAAYRNGNAIPVDISTPSATMSPYVADVGISDGSKLAQNTTLPQWALGLIIAVVVVVITIFVALCCICFRRGASNAANELGDACLPTISEPSKQSPVNKALELREAPSDAEGVGIAVSPSKNEAGFNDAVYDADGTVAAKR